MSPAPTGRFCFVFTTSTTWEAFLKQTALLLINSYQGSLHSKSFQEFKDFPEELRHCWEWCSFQVSRRLHLLLFFAPHFVWTGLAINAEFLRRMPMPAVNTVVSHSAAYVMLWWKNTYCNKKKMVMLYIYIVKIILFSTFTQLQSPGS